MHFYVTIYLLVMGIRRAFAGYDPGSKSNVAVYWGQNSFNKETSQDRLSKYCDSPEVDIIFLSFLTHIHGPDGVPVLNFANQGNNCTTDTQPFVCPEIAEDIKKCKDDHKTVLLSIGGEITDEPGWKSEQEAKESAKQIWQMFGPNQNVKEIVRPFGDSSVDGFDIDFEHHVPMVEVFANELRTQIGEEHLLTAAPQCPETEVAAKSLTAEVPLDIAFVQFYNNPCRVGGDNFNFKFWDKWAHETAPNKNMKIFVGAPAGSSAADGYNDIEVLKSATDMVKNMASFGGVMLWDASQAWANDNYHKKVKEALK